MQHSNLPKNHRKYWFEHKKGIKRYPNIFADLLSVPIQKNIRQYVFTVGGFPIEPNCNTELEDKAYINRERAFYTKFRLLCQKHNIIFKVDVDCGGTGGINFNKKRKTVCEVTGENYYTWIFMSWKDHYQTLKIELEE